MDTPDLLRLLADATRLRILHLLQDDALTVAELQEILGVGQSTVSGHLSRLKRAGFLHDLAEGSSRRYRLLSDLPQSQQLAWRLVAQLTANDPVHAADRTRRAEIRRLSGLTWIDRVAGALHREYVPGRSAEALLHSLIGFCRLGRTIDIGAGDGSLALLLAQATDDLLLLEPNEAMRSAGTQRLSALPQARYLAAQAEAIPLPDASRDSALMIQSLQYMQDPQKALAEAQRVLVPGGRLLVLTLARHEADEAHRFGHRHLGFSAEDLQTWTPQLYQQSVVLLQPESRPPRFIPLVFTGLKRGEENGKPLEH